MKHPFLWICHFEFVWVEHFFSRLLLIFSAIIFAFVPTTRCCCSVKSITFPELRFVCKICSFSFVATLNSFLRLHNMWQQTCLQVKIQMQHEVFSNLSLHKISAQWLLWHSSWLSFHQYCFNLKTTFIKAVDYEFLSSLETLLLRQL